LRSRPLAADRRRTSPEPGTSAAGLT